MKFTNAPEADKLLKETYRAGWGGGVSTRARIAGIL